MMILRYELLLLMPLWAIYVGALRSLPFQASGRSITVRNTIVRPIAPKWKTQAFVQEPGMFAPRFSSISSEVDALGTVSPESVPEMKLYEDISNQKKDGVIQRFRSRVWSRVPWNTSMDTLLLEGVNMHGTESWKKIAAHVGKSVTLCKQRWHAYIKPKPSSSRKDAKWTEEEITKLSELVTKHKEPVSSHIDGAFTTPRLDWQAIGRELNRPPRSCTSKWHSIQHGIKGHYTPEEDSLILQRVKDWGDRGMGLYVSVSQELGRPASSVRARWLLLQRERKPVVYWTEEMDAALLAAREKELPVVRRKGINPSLWESVSMRLSVQGVNMPPKSCSIRYTTYLRHALAGLRARVEWTPELVESLMEMRKKNMSWLGIGHSLKILPKVCSAKYLLECKHKLKHGPFTAEEDALIRQRVAEWGDLTENRGLWPALEKEMGRPSKRLRERWYIVLFHKDVR